MTISRPVWPTKKIQEQPVYQISLLRLLSPLWQRSGTEAPLQPSLTPSSQWYARPTGWGEWQVADKETRRVIARCREKTDAEEIVWSHNNAPGPFKSRDEWLFHREKHRA